MEVNVGSLERLMESISKWHIGLCVSGLHKELFLIRPGTTTQRIRYVDK